MEEIKAIKEIFNDDRKVEPLDDTHHLFLCEDNSIIYMDLIVGDEFTISTLIEYVEIAEELYSKYHEPIRIYLMCPSSVNFKVKEFDIKSNADFSISVARLNINPCDMILSVIKKKLETEGKLNEMDIEALSLLPVMCPPRQQHEMREEVFKILNTI
jgi:hypothetical protein